jgi:predicted acylesterase/phospholipase RssA
LKLQRELRTSWDRITDRKIWQLPPTFRMVKIRTDHFWDGGIVSNTPLQHLLDEEDRVPSLGW